MGTMGHCNEPKRDHRMGTINRRKNVKPTFHHAKIVYPGPVFGSWNDAKPRLFWNLRAMLDHLCEMFSIRKIKICRYPNEPSSTDTRTFPSGLRAIAAIFFRFSTGSVRDLLLGKSVVLQDLSYTIRCTYFTKSNTDTRFPTGLSSVLPSGVKRMFPCW